MDFYSFYQPTYYGNPHSIPSAPGGYWFDNPPISRTPSIQVPCEPTPLPSMASPAFDYGYTPPNCQDVVYDPANRLGWND